MNSFEEWFDKVKEIARTYGKWSEKAIATIDAEAWREYYFDEGFTPEEAWVEEISACQ